MIPNDKQKQSAPIDLIPTPSPDAINRLLTDPTMATRMYDRAKRMMWSVVQYNELKMLYSCALKEIQTKFEILSTECNLRNNRNPISSITTRLKSTDSILDKLERNGWPITLESMEEHLADIAGIRVICPYIDDIYTIADALLRQDDITLIRKKDYIENPKPNGYRSLHLIVSVPVFLSETKKNMKVEVQIRTIAMDFWASLEHQMKYKKDIPDAEAIMEELRNCSDVIHSTDSRMLRIREHIEAAADTPTEDEMLLERLSRML